MRSLTIRSWLFGCGLVLAATAAQAAQCGPRAEIVAQLTAKYGEAQIWRGLDAQGQILEVWAKPDGSTWTVITSAADGSSCVRDAGKDGQAVTPVAPAAGTPS